MQRKDLESMANLFWLQGFLGYSSVSEFYLVDLSEAVFIPAEVIVIPVLC